MRMPTPQPTPPPPSGHVPARAGDPTATDCPRPAVGPSAHRATQVQAMSGVMARKSRVRSKRSLPLPSIEGLQAQFGEARQMLGLRKEAPANISQKRSWLTSNEIKVPPINPQKQKRVKYVGTLVADSTTLYQGLYPDVDQPMCNQGALPSPS